MKSKEFKTSKGEFVIVDLPNATHVIKHSGYIVQSCSSKFDCINKCNKIDRGDTKGFRYIGNTEKDLKLSEITEKQAKEIVDNYRGGHNFLNYTYNGANDHTVATFSAVNSLNSLIKSLGVHLYRNPLGNYFDFEGKLDDWISCFNEEQNTFYNPYIFKKI